MKSDHLKPRYIKAEEEDKTEVIFKGTIRIGNRLNNRSNSRDRGQFRHNRGRPRFDKAIEVTIFQDHSRSYSRQNSRGSIGVITIGPVIIIEVGIGLERNHSQETIVVTELEVQAVVD